MYNLLLLAVIITITACRKQDFAAGPPIYDLIVDGGINTQYVDQYIRLSKPARLSEMAVQPISGAKVSVSTMGIEVPFVEVGTSGVYKGEVENNRNYYEPYTLHIHYQGKYYEAIDTLIEVFPILATYVPLTVQRGSVSTITIPKHIFGVSIPQQWLILPKGGLWDPSLFNAGSSFSYSHIYGTPNALNPLTRKQRIMYTALNDSVTVYKFSLSEGYSRYLYNLFQETDWKGLLSSTPSNVKGNVSGNAGGFFHAVDADKEIIAVSDINK